MLVLFTKFVENFPKKEKKKSVFKRHTEVHLMKERIFRGLQFSSPAKTNYLVEE